MKKLFIPLLVLAFVLAGVQVANAMKDRVEMELETNGTSRVLELPAEAENSHVISLGTSTDPSTGLQLV